MNLSFHSAASAFAAASSAAAFSASAFASSAGFSPSAPSAGFSASSGSPSSTSASTGSAAAPSAADFASAAVALSLAQVGEEEGASAPVLASSMGILTASSFPDFAIAITCLLSCRRRRLRSQLRSYRRRQEPRRPGHQPLQPPQPRGRRRSASTQPQRACSQPAAASRPKP